MCYGHMGGAVSQGTPEACNMLGAQYFIVPEPDTASELVERGEYQNARDDSCAGVSSSPCFNKTQRRTLNGFTR